MLYELQPCAATSPYVCDGLFVFIVCGPYCYFIPFGSDVNDCSAYVVTEIIKTFTHEAQELQDKHTITLHSCVCFYKIKIKN